MSTYTPPLEATLLAWDNVCGSAPHLEVSPSGVIGFLAARAASLVWQAQHGRMPATEEELRQIERAAFLIAVDVCRRCRIELSDAATDVLLPDLHSRTFTDATGG